MKSVYLSGSLKNWDIVALANEIQSLGFDVFCDWITPGPEADSYLLEYAKLRGWSYKQTLNSYAARHVFEFDVFHIDRCDIFIMVLPCGKSARMELGYAVGKGKTAYILFAEEPEKVDIMDRFATDMFFSKSELFAELKSLAS